MRRRVIFFLVVSALASVAHYLLVLGLSHVAISGSVPLSSFTVPVLWCLTAPMNFLLSSSFGRSLSPTPLQLIFTANSVLWGLVISGVVVWRSLRHE